MKLPLLNRDVSRLEGFSDAVFALSATLLVVSLEVPNSFEEMFEELKGFLAFGFTFFALMLIWYTHNRFFRRFGLQDGVTIFLNACLLFVILFYVYPLKFLADSLVAWVTGWGNRPTVQSYEELSTLFILYSLAFTWVFLMFSLLYAHAFRVARKLGIGEEDRRHAIYSARHFGIFAFVGVISIVVSTIGWGVSWGFPGYIYILIGPLCFIHGILSNRKVRRSRILESEATNVEIPEE